MLIVVCLDLEDDDDPIQGLVDAAAVDGADVVLLHVVDVVERAKLEDSARPGVVRASLRDLEETLDADERALLRETYDRAASILRTRGAGDVRLSVGEGRPERIIVTYLSESHAGLCVVGRRPGWKRSRDEGPRSVGHVARFIIDHAPCPVLLLR